MIVVIVSELDVILVVKDKKVVKVLLRKKIVKLVKVNFENLFYIFVIVEVWNM